MAALQIVNKLRLKHREESPDKTFPPDYEWGTLKALRGVDMKTLTRQELRTHLEARDLATGGNKRELVTRLEKSIFDEQVRLHAEVVEAEFLINADLEERGSVYVVGSNAAGQLGLGAGDDAPARIASFIVVPETRGAGVCSVAAGDDMAFAVTEDHDVLVWGGRGLGPTGDGPGNPEDVEDPRAVVDAFVTASAPRVVRELTGEETVQVSVGAGHAACVSKGGDVYVWGRGDAGQLGLGQLAAVRPTPALVGGMHEGTACRQVECGENHTLAVTTTGVIYAWGHGASGRLGIGASSRVGVAAAERHLFPAPTPLHALRGAVVRQVACGPAFCLALSETAVWSWGSGAGGVLGHGDTADRDVPVAIETLRGMTVLQVAAGTWHAAAVVLVPPLRVGGGYLYTWGAGYHGQLAQGQRQQHPRPALVTAFLATHQFVASVACGPYHNAAVTAEGELYTWGSNRDGCLGRSLELEPDSVSFAPVAMTVAGNGGNSRGDSRGTNSRENNHSNSRRMNGDGSGNGNGGSVGGGSAYGSDAGGSSSGMFLNGGLWSAPSLPFTAEPGHVGGFGAIVDGVGRGLPRSVACGKNFTVVATHPYEGATLEVARQLEREQAAEDEAWEAAEEAARRRRGADREEAAAAAANAQAAADARAAATRLCSICAECPGYEPDPVRANVCGACQHSVAFHTKANADLVAANFNAATSLAKRPAG